MLQYRILALSTFLLVACASNSTHPVYVGDEKDFEVPVGLAEKFAVKEGADAAKPVDAKSSKEAEEAEKGKSNKGVSGKEAKMGKKSRAKSKKGKKSAAEETVVDWPNRWSMNPFFQTGERYLFDITYFGATAGELEMELLPVKQVAERDAYHIRAIARTSSIFSLFYRMNDVAESMMDASGLFSHKFSLKLDESLQQRDVLELYDQRAKKVYYWSKLDHKKKGKKNEKFEIETDPFTQDGLSAFYYLRTLPLEIGKVYTFPVVTNGKLRDVRVTAIRKEVLPTKIGEIPSIVVKPEVMLDGVLKTYGDSFVWISDDPRRILLKVDAKIKVGSVIAYLREHSYGSSTAATNKR